MRFGISGLGLRAWVLGFEVWDFGFRVEGLGFRVRFTGAHACEYIEVSRLRIPGYPEGPQQHV